MCEMRVTRSRSKPPSKTTPSKEAARPTSVAKAASRDYVYAPATVETTVWTDHMSGLLFSGSVTNTLIEIGFLLIFFLIPASHTPVGSMSAATLGCFSIGKSLFTRFYNSYLEAVYFAYPAGRTQPPSEHKLKSKEDLVGRDLEKQNVLVWHDMMTLITDSVLNLTLWYCVPGFYPALGSTQPLHERALRLLGNHYLMSFGMYWSHRALHVVPYLWREIHSIHHYAKTPLSRVTYQDHWADNFGNAVVGQTFAQILIPMDFPTFVFSRIFRVAESLEKHSGHSSVFNLAHSLQYHWMPFAQMPHHHDWHHEGFKSCNYTFSSLGGLWDWVFGTRRAGRAAYEGEPAFDFVTREDKILNKLGKQKVVQSFMDTPMMVILPDLIIGACAVAKLVGCGGSVCY
jgi:sterol desaturase/sphingolipid hydroxylase (fatty acid hydroxylase superfamily)